MKEEIAFCYISKLDSKRLLDVLDGKLDNEEIVFINLERCKENLEFVEMIRQKYGAIEEEDEINDIIRQHLKSR